MNSFICGYFSVAHTWTVLSETLVAYTEQRENSKLIQRGSGPLETSFQLLFRVLPRETGNICFCFSFRNY